MRYLPEDYIDPLTNARPPLLGWLYCGSHNLSKNAWGASIARDAAAPLVCYSCELGVVLPIRDAATLRRWLRWLPFNPDAPAYGATDRPYSTHVDMARRRQVPFPAIVDALVDAGFEHDVAEDAVLAANGDFNAALDVLHNPPALGV